jgi:hypothetical protein
MSKKKNKIEIRSVESEYEEYTKIVYHKSMSEQQNYHLRRAFLAGAYMAYGKILFIGSLEVEEDDAADVLTALKDEVEMKIMEYTNFTLH